MNPGALDQLAQAADDLVGRHIIGCRVDGVVTTAPAKKAWRDVWKADVVDALEDDRRARARLREDVRIEACQRADAGAVVEDTVAADSEIDDGGPGAAGGEQSSSQAARPAPICIRSRCRSVGDRITERDNRGDTSRGPGRRCRRPNTTIAACWR